MDSAYMGNPSDGTQFVLPKSYCDKLNLRVPSGNEAGANSHWIPGGITDGGIPEAITDLILNNPENVTITYIN